MFWKFVLSLLLVAGLTGTSTAKQDFDLPSSIGSVQTNQISSPSYNAWFAGPGAYEPSWQEQANGQLQQAVEPGSIVEAIEYGTPNSGAGPFDNDEELMHHFHEPFAVPHPDFKAPSAGGKAGSGGGASGGGGGGASGGGGGGASGGGGGAGAAAANNPGVPLAQFQFQNVFVPESYEGTGYSNQFIVQPVIPIMLKPGGLFKYHIVRPTLPILAPVSDPDGALGDTAGIGDLSAFDLYFRTPEKGLVWGIGPIYTFPTSTNRQTGAGEWELGPSVAIIDSRKKSWVLGFLFEAPFSLESDAYSISVQPILTKLLKNQKYIAAGDLLLKFDDQDGGYNIPLSVKFGKVFKAGKQPVNIFIQPQYTPDGFHSGPTAKYGVKLSMSFLLPGAEFGYSKDKAANRAAKRCSRGCVGHCYCQ